MWAIIFAALCAVPAAVYELCARGVGRWTGREHGRSAPGTVPAPRKEHERFGQDLRRLSADHDRVLRGNVPAKAARLRALELAYDDTLVCACRALALEPPPTPFDAITRVQVEADLVTHGLSW